MFCSNCGKTIKPDDKVCANCGAALGDSRFEGSGYTAVQARYVPGEQPKSERYTPYTRTTYMSDVEEDEDVYARTTYRPVLAEEDSTVDEPQDEALPSRAEDEAETGTDPTMKDMLAASETAPEKTVRSDASEARQTGDEPQTARKPSAAGLKPIKVAGISPEVAAYAERLKGQKSKPKRTLIEKIGALRADNEDIKGHEDKADQNDVEDGEAYVPRPRSQKSISRMVSMAVGALAIIVLFVGGFIYISSLLATPADSKIPGVSLDVYTNGMELIESHTLQDYKRTVAKLVSDELSNASSGADAEAKLGDDKDQIEKLYLADAAKDNDRLFVNVLLKLQEDIAQAIYTEAYAEIFVDEQMTEDAKTSWAQIDGSLASLKNATTSDELTVLLSQSAIEMSTPEPEASPTPAVYKTLTKGTQSIAVEKMQNRLSELKYFNGTRDGDFGTVTLNAVKLFQQATGMTVDGIATPEMQERLYAADAPVFVPQEGAVDGLVGGQILVDPDAPQEGAEGGTDEVQPSDPANGQ